MVVDMHTHLFPDKIAEKTIGLLAQRSGLTPFANGCVAQLLSEMEEADVSLSLVLPVVTKPEQFDSITKFALKINETYSKGERKLLSFGGIHPYDGNYKEHIRELKNLGFRGIKLHPDYQNVYIDDLAYCHVIDEACKQDLIVSIHGGRDVGLPDPIHCPPDKAALMISQVRPEKLILAHLGGYDQWDLVEQYIVGKNVYLDTAVAFGICEDEQFIRIIKNHGEDKILFATDSPWSGQKESVAYLKKMHLSKETEDAILYKNAQKLLNL